MNVLETILSIECQKRELHRYPAFALLREISDRMPELSIDMLRSELRQLIDCDKIGWGKTINDIYFKSK